MTRLSASRLMTGGLLLLTAVAMTGMTACSSSRPDPRSHEGMRRAMVDQKMSGPVIGTERAARMIETARALRASEGCDRAIPTYRVIASYGRNFEVAQNELADCLLQSDRALDTAEALVWLERAARAGRTQAQAQLSRALAEADRPQEALAWALIYNDQNDRALTPQRDLPQRYITEIETRLTQADLAAAENTAATFRTETMEAFRLPPGMEDGPGGEPGRPPRR